jgi:hypothetical protein
MSKLTSSFRDLKKQTEPKQVLFSGTLGVKLGGHQIVDVPGRPGFVYVQLLNNLSELIQAYNGVVASIYGLPILVQRNQDKYEVYGRDTLRYQNWGNTPFLPIHGNTHSFNRAGGGGGDLVWVHQEQFYPLSITPSGTYESSNVLVAPYIYNWYGDWHYYPGGGSPNVASAWPTGSSSTQVLLLCLDGDTEVLHFITGSVEVPHLITGSAGLVPHIPDYDPNDDIPLAVICVTTGTTTIGWDEIYDVRQFFCREQSGGGGSGTVSGDHNDLHNFDGGAPGEYYHLTQAQETDLTDGGDSTLHYHATDRNSDNFVGTEWTDLTDGGETALHTHSGTSSGGSDYFNPNSFALGAYDDHFSTNTLDGDWTELNITGTMAVTTNTDVSHCLVLKDVPTNAAEKLRGIIKALPAVGDWQISTRALFPFSLLSQFRVGIFVTEDIDGSTQLDFIDLYSDYNDIEYYYNGMGNFTDMNNFLTESTNRGGATVGAYLRIRWEGGDLFFESSIDGGLWIVLSSYTPTLSPLYGGLFADNFNTGVPQTAAFDWFKLDIL